MVVFFSLFSVLRSSLKPKILAGWFSDVGYRLPDWIQDMIAGSGFRPCPAGSE